MSTLFQKAFSPTKGLKAFWIFTVVFIVSIDKGFSLESFFRSVDWDKGSAEVLTYDVERKWGDKTIEYQAHLVTEALYQLDSGGILSRKKSKAGSAVLRSVLQYQYKLETYARHGFISLLFERGKKASPLKEEEVYLLDWNGAIVRRWSGGEGAYMLESKSPKGGSSQISISDKAVVTTEELFIWLRSLDLKSKIKKIWLLESQTQDFDQPQVTYAEVRVFPSPIMVQDVEAIHVSVVKENKEAYQFWLSATGLNQVVMAQFPDGTVYRLKKVNWVKYWDF